jgi:hypothetical protein
MVRGAGVYRAAASRLRKGSKPFFNAWQVAAPAAKPHTSTKTASPSTLVG